VVVLVSIVGVGHEIHICPGRFARRDYSLDIPYNAGLAWHPFPGAPHFDFEAAIAVGADGLRYLSDPLSSLAARHIYEVKRAIVGVDPSPQPLFEERIYRLASQPSHQIQ